MNNDEQTPPNTNTPTPEAANETPAVNTPPAPTGDDQLFQSAGTDMNMPDEHQQTPAPVVPPVKKKKPIFAIILVILILVGAGVFYYLYSQDSSEPQTTETTQEQPAPATLSYEPNTVAYGFRASNKDPLVLYTRPAAGGERVEVETLDRDTLIQHQDTHGAGVVFSDENADIYASTDHGETYKVVREGEPGDTITDLRINEDGSKIAFGVYKESAESKKNNTKYETVVQTMDLVGGAPSEQFTINRGGAYIYNWNAQSIAYGATSCWGCDGSGVEYNIYTLENQKKTRILEDVSSLDVASISVSDDLSQLVYVKGTSLQENNEVPSLGPPYEVNTLDLATNETTSIATVGKANEKNPNGTNKNYSMLTGYSTGTNTPFYTVDNELYLVENDEGLLTFEAENTLLAVDYVGGESIITRSGEESDYLMANYSIEKKKTTSILQGDANTYIFGVTTD